MSDAEGNVPPVEMMGDDDWRCVMELVPPDDQLAARLVCARLSRAVSRTRTRVVPFDTWDPRRDPPPEHQLVVSPRSGHGDETDEEPLADTAIAVLPLPQLFHTQEPVAKRTRAKMRQLRDADDEPAA